MKGDTFFNHYLHLIVMKTLSRIDFCILSGFLMDTMIENTYRM